MMRLWRARAVLSFSAACALCVSLAAAVEAQPAQCPLVSGDIVSVALGEPVLGVPRTRLPAGVDGCDFTDAAGRAFSISRVSSVLDADAPLEPGALAQSYFPDLSDAAVAQINTVTELGVDLSLPGYQVVSVSPIGDTAVLVKEAQDDASYNDTLLVRSHSDVLTFATDDSPNAAAQLTALARAVLNTLFP